MLDTTSAAAIAAAPLEDVLDAVYATDAEELLASSMGVHVVRRLADEVGALHRVQQLASAYINAAASKDDEIERLKRKLTGAEREIANANERCERLASRMRRYEWDHSDVAQEAA